MAEQPLCRIEDRIGAAAPPSSEFFPVAPMPFCEEAITLGVPLVVMAKANPRQLLRSWGFRVIKKASTLKAHAAIRDVIVGNPTLSYQQIADLLDCSRWLVYRVAVEFDVRRPRQMG
jgi:hypothetical protein